MSAVYVVLYNGTVGSCVGVGTTNKIARAENKIVFRVSSK
jgi:hypothetical protein